MSELLPATQELLLLLLEGLSASDPDLPEIRVRAGGRHGARVWINGPTHKPLTGRWPPAQFEELRAAGYLRKLRKEESGDYYSLTPTAFKLRDGLARSANPTPAKTRPPAPAPELLSATSMLAELELRAEKARSSLLALVAESPVDTFRNDPSSDAFFVLAQPYSWQPLDRSAIPIAGEARRDAEHWLQAGRLVIALTAPEHLESFDESAAMLRRIYQRGSADDGPPAGTVAVVTEYVEQALREQLRLLRDLPGAVELEQLMIVPDTNALLQDPDIEQWVVGREPSTIVVPPQVIAELDRKKAEGNPKVAPKAETLIRKFREYGRRGNTLTGVKLAGVRRFREVALDADMSLMPSSLDQGHSDDRILASALALAATHLSSRVVLVTRDRNLQNKARLLGLPAVDVSDL